MLQHLRPVAQFARRHHQGTWLVSQFPNDLDAVVMVEPVGKGDKILGISCRSDHGAVIALDERIIATRLYVPVLAHEVAHLLLDQQEGVFLCSQGVQSPNEQDAWYGAALLSVSDTMLRRIAAGRATPRDVAERCMVPIEMVNLAYAIREAMSDGLAVSTIAARAAMKRWLVHLDRAIAHL